MALQTKKKTTVYNTVASKKVSRYHEKKCYGEVLTPPWFINKILEDIEQEDPTIWTIPTHTFFDCCCGNGNFLSCLYEKLMIGLQSVFPEEEERRSHIIIHMLYGCELNEEYAQVCKQTFKNIYTGNALLLEEIQEQHFTCIISNPPYNGNFKNVLSRSSSIYITFVETFITKCDYLCFIIPARWLSIQRNFRLFMFNQSLCFIKAYTKTKDIFGQTVHIDGDVCYFLNHSTRRLPSTSPSSPSFRYYLNDVHYPYIITPTSTFIYGQYIPFYQKIQRHSFVTRFLSSLYLPQNYFNISSNDTRLQPTKDKDHTITFHVSEQHYLETEGKLYGNQHDFFKSRDLAHWIVITSSSYHDNLHGFGYVRICKPNEVYTISFIGFQVENEEEANSLKSFMETKFCTVALLIKKMSRNIRQDTCECIPLPPLDRLWTDQELYEFFHLDSKTIAFVETFPTHPCNKIKKTFRYTTATTTTSTST